MLPPGYIGLLIADTRRAQQWERGLRAAGCAVARVETRGDDVDKGTWQIAVRRSDATKARALVQSVLSGESRLPQRPLLSRSGTIALLGIALVLALLLGLGFLAR